MLEQQLLMDLFCCKVIQLYAFLCMATLSSLLVNVVMILTKSKTPIAGYEVPEAITRFDSKRNPSTGGLRKKGKKNSVDALALAKEQFQVAAGAGCDLGLRWLKRLAEDEKLLQKIT